MHLLCTITWCLIQHLPVYCMARGALCMGRAVAVQEAPVNLPCLGTVHLRLRKHLTVQCRATGALCAGLAVGSSTWRWPVNLHTPAVGN